ncbi:MAG: hypothetical protein IJB30_02110 [Clostridia bacterium]|nr:hypothetical protein [Clostridia bacterium]
MATLFVFSKSIDDFYTASPSLMGLKEYPAWTDEAFIHACRELCTKFELKLTRSFVPIRPGRKVCFSAHHAGLAGDFALLSPCKNIAARQNEIRRWCVKSGLFSYVQPQYSTPLWIHAEVSAAPPSSLFVPYPALFPGNMGVHCLVLQRCLAIAGYPCLLTGRFSGDTLCALRRFCADRRLPPEDLVSGACWQRLMGAVSNMPQI